MTASPALPPVATLNDIPVRVLGSLYKQLGDALWRDKLLCRAQLADSCGMFPTELFVLTSVVREGLIAPLAAMPLAPHARVAALAQRIHNQLGFRNDVSTWAADAWARALGWQTPRSTKADRRFSRSSPQLGTEVSRPTIPGHSATDSTCSVSLLRSVLHAFRGTVDGLVVCPHVGVDIDNAPIASPCDAIVGFTHIRGFVSAKTTLGFCAYGIHFVGLGDGTSAQAHLFVPYMSLQSASARVATPTTIELGPARRVSLAGTTLRAKDLALLLNTVREVVTMRIADEDDRPAPLGLSQ